MKPASFWGLFGGMLLLSTASRVKAAAIFYSTTDLGTLYGSTSSGSNAINSAGQVLAHSDNNAFLWSNGQVTDLGSLGGTVTAGNCLNDSGHVVGSRIPPLALRIRSSRATSQMIDLGPVTGNQSTPSDINNAEQITGTSGNHAFLYSNNQTIDLGATDTCALPGVSPGPDCVPASSG